jgi:orotate phosphoribosyltransferase
MMDGTTQTDERKRLRDLIRELSYRNDRVFKLASGRESRHYFNLKPTMLHPEGGLLIAKQILAYVAAQNVHYLGGMAVGAVPLVSMVVALSFPKANVKGFYVRAEAKAHGTAEQIYGHIPEKGSNEAVIICEDVTTTGGSAMKAINAVRETGTPIHSLITVVDRLEGASEALAKEGIKLTALYTVDDFGVGA